MDLRQRQSRQKSYDSTIELASQMSIRLICGISGRTPCASVDGLVGASGSTMDLNEKSGLKGHPAGSHSGFAGMITVCPLRISSRDPAFVRPFSFPLHFLLNTMILTRKESFPPASLSGLTKFVLELFLLSLTLLTRTSRHDSLL